MDRFARIAIGNGDLPVVPADTTIRPLPLSRGLGAPCESDADCAGQTADICLGSPGQAGICTTEGREGGTCGDTFVCCRDCNPAAASGLPFEDSACVPEQISSQLSGGAGCTCD